MARNRTPSNILELNGAFKKNPQRRREEPSVDSELGPPPDHFDDARRAAWAEVVGMAPEGVLTRSDRIAIEMLSDLLVRYRASMAPAGDKFTSADRRDLLAILARFGMTAADRSRVSAPTEKEETGDMFDFLAKTGAA
jgi:phage terminase small subunit